MILKIIIVIILLVFSAFFSASETAIFSLDSLKLRKAVRRSRQGKNVKFLLKKPLKLLTTIIVGNMFVNITASSIAGSIAIGIWGEKGIGISIGIMTFLLLLLGEVTPKRYAIERPIRTSLFSAKPLIYFSRLFLPFHWILKVVIRAVPMKKKEPTLNEEELMAVIDMGHRQGIVAGHEKDLIGAVLGFTDTLVSDIMVKRENIRAISADLPQDEFTKLAKEFKHSKIPIYKNTLDNIMGMVYAKELFLYPEKSYGEIIRPVLSVSNNKKIKDVLRIFEDQKIKIAIVLNETGQTCGLITMEDIIEEVFGEIYDEFEILTQAAQGGAPQKETL